MTYKTFLKSKWSSKQKLILLIKYIEKRNFFVTDDRLNWENFKAFLRIETLKNNQTILYEIHIYKKTSFNEYLISVLKNIKSRNAEYFHDWVE